MNRVSVQMNGILVNYSHIGAIAIYAAMIQVNNVVYYACESGEGLFEFVGKYLNGGISQVWAYKARVHDPERGPVRFSFMKTGSQRVTLCCFLNL